MFIISLLLSIAAAAQTPQSRITQPIKETQRVVLRGHVHPLAKAKYDQGAVKDQEPASRILLQLSRTEEQEAALEKFLEEQQTPGSPNYHRWLTPQEFGEKYGTSEEDVQKITAWLTGNGFKVEKVSAARNLIEFSGTAGQVRSVFQTELHRYSLSHGTFIANNADPRIPAAFAPVVSGFVSLNNFPRHSYARVRGKATRTASGKVRPQWTTKGSSSGNSYYAVGPGDFASIYNSMPLLHSSIDGTGRTIGIVGESNIDTNDVANFRSLFGLSSSTPTVTVDGTDPGIVSAYEGEALLDVEWAGATAPGATINLVVAKSTSTTDGVDLAAEYIVDNNLTDILSESFGLCEAQLETSGNKFYKDLWQQAASQGITVVVSSGDSGSAGCENPSVAFVSEDSLGGVAVNGIASTPYNVAVGGTDFNDANSLSTYWSTSNSPDSTTGEKKISALGYIPEMTWNDSCAYSATSSSIDVCVGALPSRSYGGLQLWAGSGGPSNCSTSTVDSNDNINCSSGYSKPSWQSAKGVPSDGVRDVPDVSFFASTGESGSNSFYVVCQADDGGDCDPNSSNPTFLGMGGTSAAAPNFAAVVALAEQKVGNQRLGNINYLLYKIAGLSGSSCASSGSADSSCVFYDTQVGNISVPCKPGSPDCSSTSGLKTGVLVASSNPAYMTSSGYDTATGLGSVNITNLVARIANLAVPTISTPTASATNVKLGDSTKLSVSVTGNSSFGTPSGTITFYDGSNLIGTATTQSDSNAYALTGTLTYQPSSTGSHSITATYSGDNYYVSATSKALSVKVSKDASATISTPTASSTSVTLGNSTTLSVTVKGTSTDGVPAGTITFFDGSTSIGTATGTTSDSSNSTLTGTRSYTPSSSGSHTITATYSGDYTYSSATSSSLTVEANPAFTMSLSSTSAKVASSGGSGTNTVTFKSASSGFTGTVTYSCSSSSSAASCTPTSSSAGSVTVNNASTTGSVTYTLPAASSSAALMRHRTPFGGGLMLAGVFLFAVPGGRRRTQALITLLLIGSVIGFSSCGGGGSPSSSGQTYTFTVTASADVNGVTTTQTSTFTVTN